MTSFLKRLTGRADHPDVATYKTIRTAGKSWSAKIMRHPVARQFDILAAAKKLTLSVEGKTLVFEDEIEEAVFVDYLFLDEYRRAMWSVSALHRDRRRTGCFLHFNRRWGLPQPYPCSTGTFHE